MIYKSLESNTCALLNYKLKQIHWGLNSLIRIHAKTPGWAISGWRISIQGNHGTPQCTIDKIKAITLQTSSKNPDNICTYFISPMFTKQTIEEAQILEINTAKQARIEVINIEACDRISAWQLLHLTRKDVSNHKTLEIDSWIIGGRQEMNLLTQDACIIKHLNGRNNENTTSRLKSFIWDIRSDLQKEFKLTSSASYQAWFKTHGVKEYGLHALTKEGRLAIEFPAQTRFKNRPFGVNLFGYESSTLGIGEDLRTCRDALNLVGIPTKVINIPTRNTSEELRRDAREDFEHIAPYAFNLICMTAEEHARIFLELGYAIFSERYNIGYWPWELANWPDPWKPLFGLVDEVWASSRHTHRSIQKELNHRPQPKLTFCPLGISRIDPLTPEQTAKTRDKHALPNEAMLMICSFDGRSSFYRKNPWGTIEAFLKAFPKDNFEDVGLVIKTINASVDPSEWNRLTALAEQDDRIRVIDGALDRADLIQLYGCCDVLVSLHRAEGFGRILAECLLLGLDIVATNYSGNTDFCRGKHAHPVDYDLSIVQDGAYPYHQNQQWAEPRQDHAAEILRKIYTSRSSQKYGQTTERYSTICSYQKHLLTDSIAKHYGNNLKAIWNQSRNKTAEEFNLRWSRKQCLYGMEES